MKNISLLCLLLTCSNLYASDSKHWIFGGVDIGVGTQKSDDANEEDTSNGKYYGAKVLYQYRMVPELNLELGLGWMDYKVSNDIKTGVYSRAKMETKAPYIHSGVFYNPSEKFSFGLTANYILDNGVLVSPEDESKVFVGLGAYYNIPSEKYAVRIGANVQRSVDFLDREATLMGMSLQFGMPIEKAEVKPLKRNQVVKNNVVHTKQEVTLVTLDETLINFETDSYTLDMQSKALLADLAAFLASNQDIWETLEIEGHTDLRGSDYYNNVLSVRRAHSVYEELLLVSLPSKKLYFEGAGKQKPLVNEVSDEAFAKNRRVDLKFINVSNKAYFNAFITKLKKKYQK